MVFSDDFDVTGSPDNSKWNYDLDRNNILHFDIQRTDELINGFDDSKFGKSKGLDEIVGDKNVDLIVGGPPCQAYSMAGRVRDKNGMQDDYRNFLFENFLKVLTNNSSTTLKTSSCSTKDISRSS